MPKSKPNPRSPEDDSLIQGRNWFSAWIEKGIERITPSCQRVVRMISDSMERPLTGRGRLTLHTHYLICCYCRRYEQQLHRLRRFTIALPEHLDDAMFERLDETVKERIKEQLRDSE